MTNTSYALPLADAVVDDGLVPFAWVLNDRLALDKPFSRQKYFDRGYRLFQEKLVQLAESSVPPTAQEARELLFMLEALIDAKQGMQER